jgi:hypothetical protein
MITATIHDIQGGLRLRESYRGLAKLHQLTVMLRSCQPQPDDHCRYHSCPSQLPSLSPIRNPGSLLSMTIICPTTRRQIGSRYLTHRPLPLIRLYSAKSGQENSDEVRSPAHPALFIHTSALSLINKTLAGVAQSVERVALMTARDKPQGRGFEPLLRLFLYQCSSEQLFF